MKVSATSPLARQDSGKLLAWDSEFWGIRIAAVDHPDVDEWARENTIGCVFMLARADEIDRLQNALARGFKLTDIRITLARPAAPLPVPPSVRQWQEADVEPLAALARESHRITRFYADSRFDPDRCDDLYEAWMRNSLAGWAQHVLVTGEPGHPTGYVTVHIDGETSSIGLIAVAPEARRQGIGAALCQAAINCAYEEGAAEMTVVTQGRNLAALRVFEHAGFQLSDVSVWLHHSYT